LLVLVLVLVQVGMASMTMQCSLPRACCAGSGSLMEKPRMVTAGEETSKAELRSVLRRLESAAPPQMTVFSGLPTASSRTGLLKTRSPAYTPGATWMVECGSQLD
jgi:hypothetical protein